MVVDRRTVPAYVAFRIQAAVAVGPAALIPLIGLLHAQVVRTPGDFVARGWVVGPKKSTTWMFLEAFVVDVLGSAS